MKRLTAVLLALICAITIAGAAETIRFTNITAGTAEADVDVFGKLVQFVEDYINASGRLPEPLTIEFIPVDSYEAAILAMKYGDVQMARFGPEAYTIAREEFGAIPVAKEVRIDTGQPYYNGIIIVRADSNIWGLSPCVDWSQYTFAFVTETSASGYLVPQAIFRDIGISDSDFKEIYFAGGHEAVIVSVTQGHTDIGATTYNRYYTALENGAFDLNELRIILVSDAIPTSLIAIAPDFTTVPFELLVEAWAAIPEEMARTYQSLGYVPAQDSDYDPIRDLAAE